LKEEVYTFFDHEEAEKLALKKERDTLQMEKNALKQLVDQQAKEISKLKTTATKHSQAAAEDLKIQTNKENATLRKSQKQMFKYISYYEEQYRGFSFTTFQKSPNWRADMLQVFQLLKLLPAAITFQEFTQLQRLPSKEQVDKAIKSLQKVFHPDLVADKSTTPATTSTTNNSSETATTMSMHATNLSARLNSVRDFIYCCWEEINKEKQKERQKERQK